MRKILSFLNKFLKPYFFNIANAFFIIFVTAYIIYFWGPAVDKLIEAYKYSPDNFNIFDYIKYLKIITIMMLIGFLFLNLSIIFSNILWRIKGTMKAIPFLFLIPYIILPLDQIYRYFTIKNEILNYKGFYYITTFSFYYQYIISNCIIVLFTSAISFNIFGINEKNKKFICFTLSIFFAFALFFRKSFIFNYGKPSFFYILYLAASNIFLALVEYEEYKKLHVKA